jgi:regulator of replication initiation timing
MDMTSADGLRAELARLVAEEERLSAERKRLHDKIDFGFGTDETRERERQVSDARQDVHNRIDALRQRLGSLEAV